MTGGALRVQPRHQNIERQLAVIECIERRLLHAGEVLRKRRIAGKIAAQHDVIHQAPDESFEHGHAPVRHRRADHDLTLARISVQQYLPGFFKRMTIRQ